MQQLFSCFLQQEFDISDNHFKTTGDITILRTLQRIPTNFISKNKINDKVADIIAASFYFTYLALNYKIVILILINIVANDFKNLQI